jgi:hypothetical protein
MGVGEIPREHAPQMAFAEHDDVVQTVATYRFDQSFHVRVLPRTRRTGDDLGDAHAGDTTLADAAIDRIAISQEPFRRGVFWERGDDLLCGPFSRRMFSDRYLDDAASVKGEENQHETARGRSPSAP